MTKSLIVASHYFQRMARKPFLVLFLLAVPFTLLAAEFAAFHRAPSSTSPEPLQVTLVRAAAHSPIADRFVQCLAAQPGHPLQLREGSSGAVSIAVSGSSPVNVSVRAAAPVDLALASSIANLCALEAPQPLVPLTVERAASSPAAALLSRSNFFARFFPGLALFGAIFLAQSMASLVWRDHERSVHLRLLAMPVPASALAFGPLLFLAAGAASALLLILGICALAVNPAALASPLFWALIIGFAASASAMQLSIGLLAGSLRGAQAMSTSINIMLAFFGGGFVPLSLYPPFLRTLACALPNGAAQAGLTQILEGSGRLLWPAVTVWGWALALSAAAIVLQSRKSV